jgi:hypothetical protein
MRGLFAVVVAVAAVSSPVFVSRSEQHLPLIFNQGVARVEGGWIFSGTNSPISGTDIIERTDEDLTVLAVQPLSIPAQYRAQGYNHAGDVDVVGDTIYVPFEQSNYDLGKQVTARYDVTTLAFIDAVELPQHENSFVTVDDATMTAYSMDHFDGDSLLRYDVSNAWTPLAPLPLTMLLHHTQGADVADGAVWITTSDPENNVYRVDLSTGETTSVGTLGHTGAEGEGIDATHLASGQFHAMVNDLANGTTIFAHYDLSEGPGPQEAATSTAGGERELAATGARPPLLIALALLAFAACAWRLRGRPS